LEAKEIDNNNNEEMNQTVSTLLENEHRIDEKKYKIVIVDCVSVQFIDEAGFKCLKEIINEYEKENVKFLLTNCNGNNIFFFFN
jgi:anti-anti-sigma regulatory factor